jgi:methionyl-tRNA synthetase
MDKINYDTFSKVEVRIGTVLALEIIPEADRLLKLTVDLGEDEPRQIVSGIREFVAEPADLVGQQFPFVSNLEPRMIKGYESNGMIFAAGNNETFTLLSPLKPVPPGTKLN